MDMQTSWTASTSAETPSATDESEQQLQEAVLIAESGSIRPQNAKHHPLFNHHWTGGRALYSAG